MIYSNLRKEVRDWRNASNLRKEVGDWVNGPMSDVSALFGPKSN